MQPANPQQSSNAAMEILFSIANLLDHTWQHPYKRHGDSAAIGCPCNKPST
jgi:hypothetical protein